MKHFFRGGRELSIGQGDSRPILQKRSRLLSPIGWYSRIIGTQRSDVRNSEESYSPHGRVTFGFPPMIDHRLSIVSSVNVSQSIEKRKRIDDGAPNKHRNQDERGTNKIQGDSALVLPLYYICSTCGPKFYHRAFIRSIPGSDQRTEPRRSADGGRSEKSRTWVGLGRYLAWASFGLSSVIHCLSVGYYRPNLWLSFGSRPKNDKPTTKEQAENKQAKLLVGGSDVAPESSEKEPKDSRRDVDGDKNAAVFRLPRTKVELALTQAKTKNELGMNYQRTRNEVASIHNPSESFIILRNHS